MYVQVRTIDGKRNVTVTISKTNTVQQFKEIIEKELEVPVNKQRLFFRGKQLEDDYKIFDYDINVNDVVQLMVKVDLAPLNESKKESSESQNDNKESCSKEDTSSKEKKPRVACESLYFRVNDIVDARDSIYGAWFEGQIVGIVKDPDFDESKIIENDDGVKYLVKFLSYPDEDPLEMKLHDVRPRAREKLPLSSVEVGQTILVNHNIEEPKERGYWYDLRVTSVGKELSGALLVGSEATPLESTRIVFTRDIMKIEPVKLISERTPEELELMQTETETKRVSAPQCSNCGDNSRRKCRECGCGKCGGKADPEKQLMCDECNSAFHIWCLDPPLEEIPSSDEWYCSDCKNDENEIVKAGEKLKASKKKAKMASAKSETTRDWGKGMACVGRTKECTLVPPNHFGPIPGVEVGTLWKFRVQVSEAGVHRPHVAGIHGRESDGAYSIVLSGGYEDDIDNGDEFFYTGSGGRDLSGNKRTAQQSSDQTLTRMNKALAMNCNAAINANTGAEAKDWRKGKPVRVVRNFKLAKHSVFAPTDGNRYDGIYKVVKYYKEKGKSGFHVWRYVLRRDDPVPAPWTKEGKKRVAALGLDMLYPEGYLAAMEKKQDEGLITSHFGKRVLEDSGNTSGTKRPKTAEAYKFEPDVKQAIAEDKANTKAWALIKDVLSSGRPKVLTKVEEVFMCVCCQELVHKPITTPCSHNICLVCLQRSFTAQVYTCPYCRTELGKKFDMQVNTPLQEALHLLFPGYSAGR